LVESLVSDDGARSINPSNRLGQSSFDKQVNAMAVLPYQIYDADNHLYEPEEAFLRHLPQNFSKEFYFVDVNGRRKLVIGGMVSEYIPNPTFAVVAAPGVHEKWYRAENVDGLSLRDMTGKVLRPPPEWRSGEGRLEALQQQGVHSALIFPTLASAIEARLGNRADTVAALFSSLNKWLEEDWGFARDNRLFAVPFISLIDVDAAIAELERVLRAGARCVGIRPAPVPGIAGSRSFGQAEFDPFWARCAEAKIFVCLHSSDSGYDQIYRWWASGGKGEFLPFEKDAFGLMLEPLARPITDSLSALLCHGALDRNPGLRIVCVENNSEWVGPLLKRFDRAYGQMPKAFSRHPRETFHKHVFVAPAYEDDMDELATFLPAERILFGSDFPHPEGLAEPLAYLKEFENFSSADVEKIFSSNLKGLLQGVRN
jgi:predicted TIM-barrel fold metal-dependent hydrolase